MRFGLAFVCYMSAIMADSLPTVDSLDSWSSTGKCYPKSSLSGTTAAGVSTFQTSLLCESNCKRSAVVAISGTSCFCSNVLPNAADAVDISNCDITCNSLGNENCGGNDYYFVYENSNPQTVISPSSSLSSTTTSSRTSTSISSNLQKSSSSSSPSSSLSSLSQDALTSSSSSSNDIKTITSTFTPDPNYTAVIISTTIVTPSATHSSSSNSGSSTKTPSSDSKSVSGGTIAGAVVGSVAGAALIVAAIFFLLMWRRKHANDSDVEDDFILSGPNEKNMSQDVNSSIAPNPFLLAGGYKFDDEQMQNHHDDSSQQFVGVPSSISDNSTSYGHSRQTSQLHGGSYGSQHGGGDYQSSDDVHYVDDNSNNNTMLSRPRIGSRKLSNGSLPDIKGNTRSLKVVNN